MQAFLIAFSQLTEVQQVALLIKHRTDDPEIVYYLDPTAAETAK